MYRGLVDPPRVVVEDANEEGSELYGPGALVLLDEADGLAPKRDSVPLPLDLAVVAHSAHGDLGPVVRRAEA